MAVPFHLRLIATITLLAFAGTLLVFAQTSAPASKAPASKPTQSGAKTPSGKKGTSAAVAPPITIKITHCQVDQQTVHADKNQQIIFLTDDPNETYFVFISTSKLFGLKNQVFRIKQGDDSAATVQIKGNPNNPVTFEYWVDGCSCTRAKVKGRPQTSDPNDIIVP